VRAEAVAAGLGLGLAVLVSGLLGLLPLPANVANSTIPWQVGGAAGVLLALRLASRVRPEIRPWVRHLGLAFGVTAAVVGLALVVAAQFSLPLNEGGGCKSSYYRAGGVCLANALHRGAFPGWTSVVSGLGLLCWVSAFVVERRRGLKLPAFTAILLGLALGAGTLQNAHYVHDSLSFEGERVRAWNVFHYYLGSKYYKELGHQDIYAAVLAADDDYQERVRAQGGEKEEGRLKRSWRRIKKARDLRTYTVRPRKDLVERFDRSAFTEERLRELGRDSRFLKRYMGFGNPGWAQCFTDLGFNPAPPWTVIGTPLANLVPTKWPWFWLVSNSDLALYLLAFGLIWWAFGLRVAAVMTLWLNCAQLNEARFTGGFLQYDWLVSCLASVAFYRRGFYRSAGVALSWGAMTRVFPGFLVFPIGLKILGAIGGIDSSPHEDRDRISWAPFLGRIQRSHWNFGIAFTLACALLFGASCVTGRGLQNWGDWVEKIANHSTTHPITSSQRVGVGRMAVHQPRPMKGKWADVPLWKRIATPKNKYRFWSTISGKSRDEKIALSQPRKRFLQLLALPFLLLALLRRKDTDGMILMLFGVFIAVTVSRYYASTWALLFALGAASASVTALRERISVPALVMGGTLLGINACFYLPRHVSTSYFALNYVMYGAFLAVCIGYIVSDVKELRSARRRRRSDRPSE